MPYSVNGFGTWYYGRTNVRSAPGVCESCGQEAMLTSYDATLYLTALYLPLVPLGRRKVFNDCGHCRRHRAIRLGKWQELRDREIAEAMQALRSDPHDEEKALRLISAAVAFDAEEALSSASSSLASVPTAKAQAALGSALELFGRHRDAEAAFGRALRFEDDPELHESLALSLMRQDRPHDARRHLQHVLDGDDPEKIGLLYLLVESYQAIGRHGEALNLLQSAAQKFPQITQQPEYRKYRGISEKHRTTGERVPSTHLAARPPDERAWAARAASLVGPGLLSAVVIGYVIMSLVTGTAQQVHVVNGLDRQYTVQIGPRTLTVPPYQHRKIYLPEGEHTMRIEDGPPIPPQTFHMRTPFLTRPFHKRTFVANPDTVAVLPWEEAVYSVNPGADEFDSYELYAGRPFYTFKRIDYEFADFPETIKLGDERDRVTRRMLMNLRDFSPMEVLNIVAEDDEADLSAAVVALASAFPDAAEIVFLLPILLETDEAVALMRQRLAERPVLVEWHRAYQETIERNAHDHDLQQEYLQYVQQEPDEPALMYLLGRVTEDRAEATRLMRLAADADPPVVRSIYALAYEALSRGEFEETLRLIRRTQEQREHKVLEWEALRAMRRYEEVLHGVRSRREEQPFNRALAGEEVYLLLCLGETEAAAAVAEAFRNEMFAHDETEAAERWRREISAIIAYVQEDLDTFCREAGGLDDLSWQFAAALTEGRLDSASAVLEEYDGTDAMHHLMLAIACAAGGSEELAAAHRQLAIDSLRAGGRTERRLARWLAGQEPPDPAEVLAEPLLPDNKRVALVALGLMWPEHRHELFAQAAALNYDRRFPHLLVRQITAAAEMRAGR